MTQERFDVFLTGDRNLQFQQHVPATGVAVVMLRARKHTVGAKRFRSCRRLLEADKRVTARHNHGYSPRKPDYSAGESTEFPTLSH